MKKNTAYTIGSLIVLLILSIIGLKLVSKESDKQDIKAIEEISKDLGINELDNQLETLNSKDLR